MRIHRGPQHYRNIAVLRADIRMSDQAYLFDGAAFLPHPYCLMDISFSQFNAIANPIKSDKLLLI